MSDRYTITPEEAISCLPPGDRIHTAVANGMWVGADWDRQAVIDHITKAGGAQLAGPTATRMGHGICLHTGRRLFCEHDAAALAALEAKIAGESSAEGDRITVEIFAAVKKAAT